MKAFSKTLALLLCSVLMIILFSGCAGNISVPTKPNADSPAKSSSAAPDTAPDTSADTAPDTVPDTLPGTAAESENATVSGTVPDTKPQDEPTVPETLPATEAETVPVTVPVTEPATVPVTEPVTVPVTEPVTVPVTEPETTAEPTHEVVGAAEYMKQGQQFEEAALAKAAEVWRAASAPSEERMLLQQLFSPDTFLALEESFFQECFDDLFLYDYDYASWFLFKAFLPDTTAADYPALLSALNAYQQAVVAGGGADAEEAVNRVAVELLWGRPSRVEWQANGDGGFFTGTYSYDESGRPGQVFIEKDGEEGGLYIRYGYDEAGRETLFSIITSDDEELYRRAAAYDEAGNIIALTIGIPDDWDMFVTGEWTYDTKGRIQTACFYFDSEPEDGALFSFTWQGDELTELLYTSEDDGTSYRIVPVVTKDDGLTSVQLDLYGDSTLLESAPLFEASVSDDGLIHEYNYGQSLVCPADLNGDEVQLTIYCREGGAAVERYKNVTDDYDGSAVHMAYDYDPYGRLTYFAFHYEDAQWDEFGSRELAFTFDEYGLRTKAEFYINGLDDMSTFTYSYGE